MQAIQIQRFGGPEVLELHEVPDPEPGPGSVLVDVEVAGVNFTDANHRAGLRGGSLPAVPGIEGAGRVAALGPGTDGVAVGDRVAWKAAPASYAERVVVAAQQCVPVPEGIPTEVAGAAILQGLTAEYLAHSAVSPGDGETAVVHAAAGGVGLLLVQFLAARGVRVLGTTSSPEKAALVREAGAHAVIGYEEDLATAVAELAGERGASVVYDSIGADTFEASFACLGSRGQLLLYGTASGSVPPFDLDRLGARSISVSRPSLPNYTRTRDELLERANVVFAAIASGALRVHVGGRYPLAEASRAHEALASRRSTGKLLLEVAQG